MAFVPFTDTGKLCLDFTWHGVGVSICLNFEKPSATVGDYEALVSTGALSAGLDLVPDMSNDCTLNSATVYDMSSDSAPVYTSTNGLPVTGSGNADGTPSQTALVVSHRTGLRGRSFRGRSYMPGLDESYVVDGLITAAVQAAWLSNFEDFIDGIEATTGWTHVVSSRQSNGVDRPVGLNTPVTEYIVTQAVRTQRRRAKTV